MPGPGRPFQPRNKFGKGRPKGAPSVLPKVRALLGEEIAGQDEQVRKTIRRCLVNREHLLRALLLYARTNNEVGVPASVLLAQQQAAIGEVRIYWDMSTPEIAPAQARDGVRVTLDEDAHADARPVAPFLEGERPPSVYAITPPASPPPARSTTEQLEQLRRGRREGGR